MPFVRFYKPLQRSVNVLYTTGTLQVFAYKNLPSTYMYVHVDLVPQSIVFMKLLSITVVQHKESLCWEAFHMSFNLLLPNTFKHRRPHKFAWWEISELHMFTATRDWSETTCTPTRKCLTSTSLECKMQLACHIHAWACITPSRLWQQQHATHTAPPGTILTYALTGDICQRDFIKPPFCIP